MDRPVCAVRRMTVAQALQAIDHFSVRTVLVDGRGRYRSVDPADVMRAPVHAIKVAQDGSMVVQVHERAVRREPRPRFGRDLVR